MNEAKLYIAGQWEAGAEVVGLTDKFDGGIIARVHHASREQVDRALADLEAAQRESIPSAFQRGEILDIAAGLLEERRERFLASVIDDAGFTVGDAQREVDRGIQTLRLSAEAARGLVGQTVSMEGAAGQNGRIGFTRRYPLGVVVAITPFNSPLNTVIHKVGPALAAGNAVILKPASLTPLTGNLFVELLLDAGLPPRLISVVHGRGSSVGDWLLESPVPSFYAFTGSTEVGRRVREKAGIRRSQLELGSLASTIVMADADLEKAAELCVGASFRKAGQVCTSVQRLFVESAVFDAFVARFVEIAATKQAGDPRDPVTFVGPLISTGEADRLESWISEAVASGATLRLGGERAGNVISPTVLTDVPLDAALNCREAFGPVVSIFPFTSFDDAIRAVNDTPYGLACGIFTTNLDRALDAADQLRMGSVHVNETSNGRVDRMPYGAAKESGLGQEGPHYAVHEMTQERLITLKRS